MYDWVASRVYQSPIPGNSFTSCDMGGMGGSVYDGQVEKGYMGSGKFIES